MAGPSYHGRTHLPGGTDPIPGLPTDSGTASGDFAEYVASISDLTGYWRLGEGAPPYADTSGYVGASGDLTQNSPVGSTAMTEDVTPGLLPVEQDDGAVGFNYQAPADGGLGPDNSKTEFLTTAVGSGTTGLDRYKPDSITGEITMMCLLAPGDMPNNHSGPAFSVEAGMMIGVRYPARTVQWKPRASVATWLTSPALASGETVLVHAVYDGTTASLYLNNTLVDSAAMASVGEASSANVTLGYAFGFSTASSLWPGYYYGVVDECAIWQKALTSGERGGLFDASGPGTAEPAGYVWTADGTGGASWEAPTIEVTY